MEKLLTQLFDFQRFEREPELQRVIDSAHARRRPQKLELDDVELVAAAGSPYTDRNPDRLKEKRNDNP